MMPTNQVHAVKHLILTTQTNTHTHTPTRKQRGDVNIHKGNKQYAHIQRSTNRYNHTKFALARIK